MPMISADLAIWPWNDQAALKDMGRTTEVARVILLTNVIGANGNVPTRQVLFHVTSAANASRILRDGPQANVCKVGFAAAPSAMAFFCSNLPFIPHAIEQYMPHVDAAEDIAILKVTVPIKTAEARYGFSPSWGMPEYALQPEDISRLEPMPAAEFHRYRTPAAVERLRGYVRDSLKDGQSVSPYVVEAVGLKVAA